MRITEFRGEYRFLSNFYPSPIEWVGIEHPTAEHAYQASKFDNFDDKVYISKLRTPREAKAYGKGKQPKNWHELSIPIMYGIVSRKFRVHKDLREKLLATGNAELIEGNYWNDTFWGECPIGVGENHLGRILMEVREWYSKE